ncbi:MAG TPA: hypothetical protein ENK79_02860 [Campylobacterales bacterium]|nr:hypothetical protein [Campylobacterales bacterium]
MNILEALTNPINAIIVIIILILAGIDIVLKKDLKSQIVSLGVLGTFIGIFMGLQDFNPSDMKNSIDTILIGLKTAFFTSIAGMGVALILSILQKLLNTNIDDGENQERILAEISNKLNYLEKTDKIINELKENSTKENQALVSILNLNFNKMNHSLEIAIEKLSKGATEEIINALKKVIEDFNQELQTQFGENFVKLNESIINLVQWQNSYKSHIEELENHLKLSNLSIEKSKDTLEIISSKNQDILKVYQELKHIIDIYDRQINELNSHLQTYANLSSSAKEMFSSITHNISNTKSEFSSLTEHIKEENRKQINYSQESNKYIINNFERNQKELELISNHFKNLGEQIPKSLQVSLENLNRGLTSLTTQFQKDYKETMNRYREDI